MWAPWEWGVTLLKDHYCVTHVVVNKMNTEGGPTRGPTQRPSPKDLPRNSYIGHATLRVTRGKEIIYVRGSTGGGWWGIPLRYPLTIPCFTCQCVDREPAARYTLQSGQRTHRQSNYQWILPSPVIHRPQASMEWPPMA